MPISHTHDATILRFWRSVETFALPESPARKNSERLLHPGVPLPWEAGQLPAPKEGYKWRHTLYFHIIAKSTVIRHLADLTGTDEFLEGAAGESCLSALTLDNLGRAVSRAYVPAAFIYGIKAIREKRNLEVVTDWLIMAQQDYQDRWGVTIGPPPDFEPGACPATTWTQIQKELDHLNLLASNKLPSLVPLRCISGQVTINAAPEAPFLNSYYLEDLDTLIRHPQDIGKPLKTFLTRNPSTAARTHLLEPKVLKRYVQKPSSPGRWPSNPCHGLYTAQYAALKISLSESSPLIGINGPPGTGKSTLLREIVAAIVVNRARRILSAGPSGLFQQRRFQLADRACYYRPEPGIIGSDGIVVSGNNNSAIENVSHQLPLKAGIDYNSFPDAEYFSAFASNVLEKPCWGLVSADLGRSRKRSDFIEKFWFNGENGFGRWLRRQYEDDGQAKANAEKLRSATTRLQSLLSEFDIAIGKVPAPDFDGLCHDDIQRATPYASEQLNALRSHIFLQSLRVHEWTIRHNARYFYQNLGSFVDMLKGKWKENIDGRIAEHLWNTFFFCVPVVSVTLASFQRQFQPLGQGAIGWLLLDEAGQATLPSVCGALWRCRQCIFIGDTRQIPPVVTIPKALSRLLQEQHGIKNDDWSPSKYSAQHLADRITTTGAYIPQNNEPPIWTGIPLRAHHRCHEPMFSIANTIAYNNQMVQSTPGAPPLSIGPSCWFDVCGNEALDDHTITRELEFIEVFLQPLSRYPNLIFVISPFRSIADFCRSRFETSAVKCGTIHTFQGKEADIVILVLGTRPENIAARNWAASGPNMLNVAVTRARYRLYIVGNRTVWSKHRYFDILAASLPVRPHV